MRRFVRQVHLWLGLSLGLLFVLLGLTGSALVFYTEIDGWLNPMPAAAPAPVDWNRAVSTVRAAFPDKGGPWRFEVTGTHGPIPARYYNPPETAGQDFAPMMVWLSPDATRVTRKDYWGDYAMTFLYDLHFRLLLGEVGGVVLGYMGMALFVLLLTGLWAWWPKGSWRKALRYKARAPKSRTLRDIHKLTGLWCLALLLMLTVTGVMLELPDESDAVLAATLGPVAVLPKPRSQDSQGTQIPLTQAMASAQVALPDARMAWMEVPGTGDGVFKIRMAVPGDPSDRFPHSFVWIDQYSGKVLAKADARAVTASSTVNNWVHALHDGSAGGLPLRIAIVFAGLAPLILFITGWMRWRSGVSRPPLGEKR